MRPGAGQGGPWADRSTHVDPVLAELARAVNDLSSDQARPALAPLIPWLIASDRVRSATGVGLAMAAAAAAMPSADPRTVDRLLVAMDETATLADVDCGRRAGLVRRHRRHAVKLVRLAVATVAQAPADHRDVGLRQLLVAGINEHRRREALSPLTGGERGADDCRGSVAVTGRLVAPDGGDSMHLRCAAAVDRWPSWLQDSWDQRRRELRAAPRPPRSTDVISPGLTTAR